MKTPISYPVSNAPDADHDYGTIKDSTTTLARDGTKIAGDIVDNLHYALLAVMKRYGVTPSGVSENTNGENDFLDAVDAGIIEGRGFVLASDFGAVGDGVTDDTAAFASLESSVSNMKIDLLGETYLVDSIPATNTYFNGEWKLSGGGLIVAADQADTIHNKRIKLSIPSKFSAYNAVLALQSAAFYYPQGLFIDEVDDVFYVSYSSDAGAASVVYIVKYDWTTGEELGYLQAGTGFAEGFAVVHISANTFLYVRDTTSSIVSPIIKYDITSSPLAGETPPVSDTYSVGAMYQMGFFNNEFYIENGDDSIGVYADGTHFTKYDIDFNPIGTIDLPISLTGRFDGLSTDFIKRQAFGVGPGFMVGAYGSITETDCGVIKYNSTGGVKDIAIYDGPEYMAIMDAIDKPGINSTRAENEGVSITEDGRVYTLMTLNAVANDTYFHIVEEFSDGGFDATNFTSAGISYTPGVDYDTYFPQRGVNEIMLHPINGNTLASLDDICDFMSEVGCRIFTFYTTSFPGILDFDDVALNGSNICTITNANNNTFTYSIHNLTSFRMFWVVGGPREQTEMGRIPLVGDGVPTISALPGTLYTDINGGAGSTLYVKEIGTGNTGWVAMPAKPSAIKVSQPSLGWSEGFDADAPPSYGVFGDFTATLIECAFSGTAVFTIPEPAGGWLRTFNPATATDQQGFDFAATLGHDLNGAAETYTVTPPASPVTNYNPLATTLTKTMNAAAELAIELQGRGVIQ